MTVYAKFKEHKFTGQVFTLEGMQKAYNSYLDDAKMYIQGFIDQSYRNIEIQKTRTPKDWWAEEDKLKWKDGVNYIIESYNRRITNLENLLLSSNKDIIDYYLGMRGIEFEEILVQE